MAGVRKSSIRRMPKVTGRYQLQFPIIWVRERLTGRTAEHWRALIMESFEAASAAERTEWKESFHAAKIKMLTKTLTVDNRSGRRFDRDAYRAEAQAIYGPGAVPDDASPKLLARCFQHSVDFICERGVLAGMPVPVADAAGTDRCDSHGAVPSRTHSSDDTTDAFMEMTAPSDDEDLALLGVADAGDAGFCGLDHSVLSDEHTPCLVDDVLEVCGLPAWETTASLQAVEDRGVQPDMTALDACGGFDHLAATAASATRSAASLQRAGVPGVHGMPVWAHGCDQRLGEFISLQGGCKRHALGPRLVALAPELDGDRLRQDLASARQQRDEAVLMCQDAVSRAEQLKSENDSLQALLAWMQVDQAAQVDTHTPRGVRPV
jgi:hypothetical protein